MNKTLLSILVAITSLMIGCNRESPHGRAAYELMDEFSKEMELRYDLFLYGRGGRMMYDIEELSLHFWGHHKLSVDQCRHLYVEIVKGLIEKVNENQKIRPYLHDYPFSEKNIELTIAFRDENGNRRQAEYVALVYMVDDKLVYDQYDAKSEKLKDLHEEPYEEAVRIVERKEKAGN